MGKITTSKSEIYFQNCVTKHSHSLKTGPKYAGRQASNFADYFSFQKKHLYVDFIFHFRNMTQIGSVPALGAGRHVFKSHYFEFFFISAILS